jgi:DMSO/TMAO reductase YedYZ molybdopterin-dependent catalytic subunit
MNIISRRQRFTIAFLAGLLAGVAASLLMWLLSATINGILLPEVVGATFTFVTPLPVFEYLHRVIGGDAKYYLFVIIMIGQCLVFALAGGLWGLLATRFASEQGALRWFGGLLLALGLWLITGLIVLPLQGVGIFGLGLNIGMGNTMFSLALVGIAFGLLFIYFQNWLLQRHLVRQGQVIDEDEHRERRVILQRGLILLGVASLGALAWRFIVGGSGSVGDSQKLLKQYTKKISPPPVPNYGDVKEVAHLSPEVSPNDQFYIVSKNLVSDPTVDEKNWSLSVEGEVAHPYSLSYEQLKQMPLKEQYESLMCISNEVGGSLMNNAKWEGIPLVNLLEKAGVKDGVKKVVFYAADDYSDSITLAKAQEPTTMLALRMNDETLAQQHGFPARMLVPGIYGMKHVKWITKIRVGKEDYQGFWQQRGWSDPAPVRMTARIDTPLPDDKVHVQQATYISGVAFSGKQGISQVDISFDQGDTWQRATLKKPHSGLTWVLWQLPWTPEKAGTYTILARAIDLEGNVQSPEVAPPLPSGSSGYHSISVTAIA